MRSLLCAVVLAACSLSCQAKDAVTVDPREPVAGKTQAEWSQEWWQWAGSFDYSVSPVADKTGIHCGRGQRGSVWFLAGTYGSERVKRTCQVPAGVHLFFPLVNYVVIPTEVAIVSCEAVTSKARALTDNPSALILDVDGKVIPDLARFRQESPGCFDVAARSGSQVPVFPSAANGYYVMLRPLKPGVHTINFGGILPSATQAISYELHVK